VLRAALCILLIALPAAGAEFAPGRVLYKLRDGRRGRSSVSKVETGLAELRARAEVEWAEPDYLRQRAAGRAPDDELYFEQWALPLIHAPEAWARTVGSEKVTVAVLDTGIRVHPDLQPRLVAGWDFVSDPASAADGDGRDPDPTDEGDLSDSSTLIHGTHIAGIIGAISDNQMGVAGLDWRCRVQPIRVLGVDGGRGADSDIADAIRWASGLHVDGVPDNATPADVINLSFDGVGLSHTLQEAVDDARGRGAILVAAAGNRSADARQDAPAGLDGVIAVGAVDRTGAHASYSNFGPAVALWAPGGTYDDSASATNGIVSTLFRPPAAWTYGVYTGTSQAAPYVAGAIALMKANDPSLSADRARELLVSSAGPGGLLDVDAALAAAATPPPPSSGCRIASGPDVPLALAPLFLLLSRRRGARRRRTPCTPAAASAGRPPRA
jgi:serine protease